MLLNKNDSILLSVDVQEKLIPHIFNKDQCIQKGQWLLKLAAKMQVPAIASEQYPKGLGSTIPEFHSYISEQQTIEKMHFSCMQEPSFVHLLNEHKKNQIILFGIESHDCVLQTAFELKEAGFEVFVVVDAVGSRSEFDYKYGLKRMKQAGIHLVTAEMVFFEWLRQSNVPDFKALSKEFLQ